MDQQRGHGHRQRHLYDVPVPLFQTFRRRCEKLLDIPTLDGDERANGYSLQSAYEAWQANFTPREYASGRRVE